MSHHTHRRTAEIREALSSTGFNSITNAACKAIADHIDRTGGKATPHGALSYLSLQARLHVDEAHNVRLPHENVPPFRPDDYRERCPRCHHTGIQTMTGPGLYECSNCSAVYFACPACGSRLWDEAPDGRPARCQDCGQSFNGPMIL